MVQLASTADDGDEPFAAFEALLAPEYPRAHARLALEKVTDRGLLYLWKGASSDRPVVLMAHYDVVPAAEGWNPFDGTINDGIVWGRGTLQCRLRHCQV